MSKGKRERMKGSVESKRSTVACRAGGACDERQSFGVALAEKPIAPFLLPAHRTGRDHFGHPALGRVSHGGMHRSPPGSRFERHHAQFPEPRAVQGIAGSQTGNLMPAAEKAADRVVHVELYRVPRLGARAVGEVGCPAPHGAVQGARHVRPRRLVPGPQNSAAGRRPPARGPLLEMEGLLAGGYARCSSQTRRPFQSAAPSRSGCSPARPHRAASTPTGCSSAAGSVC